MKRLTITDKKLIDALRRMAPETGSLICFGCGYERRCSVHGCAVLKAAVGRLEELTAPPSNDPLTLEHLREMDGEPVWVQYGQYDGEWVIVSWNIYDAISYTRKTPFMLSIYSYGKDWLAYRRKPEEVPHEH